MNVLWTYFWPCFAIGLLVGGLAGTIAYRRPARRNAALAIGAAVSLGLVALWHGPLGAADRLADQLEKSARQMLIDRDAPPGLTASIHHGPLSRKLVLSGPADDFQRAEAARLLEEIPGVADAGWSEAGGIPLIVEAFGAALAGFVFGLGLAYLAELRRRHNSQWTW